MRTITDRLIVRTIQTQRMVDAGRNYWHQNRVSDLQVDGDVVSAKVRGGDVYSVNIELLEGDADAIGWCTCPIGTDCKHVAAVLFALRARDELQVATTPKPAPRPPLPAELGEWVEGMAPITNAIRARKSADEEKIVYYVIKPLPVARPQPGASAKKIGGKGKAASEEWAGEKRRLSVQALDVPVDADGNPRGAGKQVQIHQITYNPTAMPLGATTEDVLLLRRLGARIDENTLLGCISGLGGFDLLKRVVATGRAHWQSAKGTKLVWADEIQGEFRWRIDDRGQMQLALALGDAPEAMVALLSPPLAIDPEAGTIRPIATGIPPRAAEHLLSLPPVPASAVGALTERWPEIAPEGVLPPSLPHIRDLPRVRPKPVLTLLLDKVQARKFWSFGAGSGAKAFWALARLSFDYGRKHIGADTSELALLLRDRDETVRLHRDPVAESEAFALLDEMGLLSLSLFDTASPTQHQAWDRAPIDLSEPSDFANFLINDAPVLRAQGWRIEQASSFALTFADIDEESFRYGIESSETDWFDLSLGAIVDGERVDLTPTLISLLKQMSPQEIDRLIADTEADTPFKLAIAMSGGRIAPIPLARILPMLKALLVLAGLTGETSKPARIARHDLGILEAVEAASGTTLWRGAESLRLLARNLATSTFEPTPLPPDFAATLRPYQQTGLDWLQALDAAGFGGLLADDMGLGKTVQTLAHIAVLKTRGAMTGPVMIVSPTSVLPNWQAEIARFAPTFSTLLLHGAHRHSRIDEIPAHDIVLTSYPLLSRDEKKLADITFGLIVYDEAHVLKNPRTASHGTARRLKAARRIALSGTPVENRLTDAWSLFDLVVPGLLGSLSAFTKTYRTPIEKHGNPTAKASLARRLKPFLLRRTKDAVATDLPKKSLIPELIDMVPDQMALHESQRLLMHQKIRDEIERVGLMRAQIILLSALTRLRQICCDPRLIAAPGTKSPGSAKLDRLLEMLEELIPEGRRIILFSQFTSMLDLIKPELDRREIPWVELTGQTKDRKTPVARFQAGEVPLILVSLKAGGTGLNLTAADTVLLYDPWWNPAIEAQAIDRAHRIGQTKPVFVHRLIAKGTIEEKILALQARKAAIAETLWSEDTAALAQLSEEDIAFLLSE